MIELFTISKTVMKKSEITNGGKTALNITYKQDKESSHIFNDFHKFITINVCISSISIIKKALQYHHQHANHHSSILTFSTAVIHQQNFFH